MGCFCSRLPYSQKLLWPSHGLPFIGISSPDPRKNTLLVVYSILCVYMIDESRPLSQNRPRVFQQMALCCPNFQRRFWLRYIALTAVWKEVNVLNRISHAHCMKVHEKCCVNWNMLSSGIFINHALYYLCVDLLFKYHQEVMHCRSSRRTFWFRDSF